MPAPDISIVASRVGGLAGYPDVIHATTGDRNGANFLQITSPPKRTSRTVGKGRAGRKQFTEIIIEVIDR